jgi:hypothetical protein
LPEATDAMPPPPGAPPPAWTSPPPSAKAGKSSRKLLVIVVAVVVIIAALLGGLWAAKVGPFAPASSSSSSSPPPSSSGETYSAAAATATPSASSVGGGPWKIAGGVSVVISTSITVNSTALNSTAAGAGCHARLLSQASGITSIPGTSASASSGLSNAWIILFANASIGILEVAVFNGVATPLLTLSIYGGCSTGVSAVGLPSSYVDSPAAASLAYNYGGSAWVKAWPSYDLEEILVPSISVTFGGHTTTENATWEVVYTDCNLGADDGTTLGSYQSPAQLTVSINATTGAFVRALNTTTACASASSGGGGGGGGGGKPSLSSSCYLPFSEESSTPPPTYWNNGSLICTIKALTGADVTVSIENSTTSSPVSTTGFTLEVMNETTLAVVSTYNFGTNTWSSPGADVESLYGPLFWVLVTSATMAGNKIVVTATASAPATGSISGVLGGT